MMLMMARTLIIDAPQSIDGAAPSPFEAVSHRQPGGMPKMDSVGCTSIYSCARCGNRVPRSCRCAAHQVVDVPHTSFSKRAGSRPRPVPGCEVESGQGWMPVGTPRKVKVVPPCFPCLGGLGASEEPHGPVDHLSETTGSTLHKVGALVENHS